MDDVVKSEAVFVATQPRRRSFCLRVYHGSHNADDVASMTARQGGAIVPKAPHYLDSREIQGCYGALAGPRRVCPPGHSRIA